MKKILVILPFFFMSIMVFGESKYFPVGTTWTERVSYLWTGPKTITYTIKGEMMIDGVSYNEVIRDVVYQDYDEGTVDGERCCLLREEGPLVYMRLNEETSEGLLYDFDWWEGKEYVIDFPSPDYNFKEVINKIEEIVLEDGQTYQIWQPEGLWGAYIICGIGCTDGILFYYENMDPPIGLDSGEHYLLEFTREVPIYNKENGTGLLEVGIGNRQKSTRPIRLKRNDIGGYDLQVKNSDGVWQNVK